MANSKIGNVAGNFKKKIDTPMEIDIKDFENPWNFYFLFNQPSDVVIQWCVKQGLLLESLPCSKDGCVGNMTISQRVKGNQNASLRCSKNRNHEMTIRKNSFFEKSKLMLQDIFLMVKNYLDGLSLAKCAKFTGISYKSTAVDWASMIREVFKEYYMRELNGKKLEGEIEIDESLFGRRVKYHKGNPNKGLKVWVFGMVDRKTNTILLYPVSDRREETLVRLIQKHVMPGSTIYSDGWSAYCNLNELGYKHFTVLHKYAFKKEYKNVDTGELITVHTNRIEGAWKHAKDHFRRMSGTNATQWEGHLAEIMWRSHVKGYVYEPFFNMVRFIYTLDHPPQYTYTTPLFDSWHGFSGTDMLQPAATDCESTDSEKSSHSSSLPTPAQREMPTGTVADPLILSSDSEGSTCRPMPPPRSGERELLLRDMFESSPSESDNHGSQNKTLTPHCENETVNFDVGAGAFSACMSPVAHTSSVRPKRKVLSKKKTVTPKRSVTDNVCHPRGFKQVKVESKKSKKRESNPYSKSNFVWNWSSDEDFKDHP